MLLAKDKFREGWILLLQPFQFVEMNFPLQKHTIIYAYSEKPTFKRELIKEAKEKIDEINNSPFMAHISYNRTIDDVKEEKILEVSNDSKNYNQIYTGEIVQAEINGIVLRFFPNEYNILSEQFLVEVLQDEGYHTIIDKKLERVKEYRDRFHYLQSRGITAHNAKKWASIGYKDLVYYKPYGTLVEMYCRSNEIYLPDSQYIDLGDTYLQENYKDLMKEQTQELQETILKLREKFIELKQTLN